MISQMKSLIWFKFTIVTRTSSELDEGQISLGSMPKLSEVAIFAYWQWYLFDEGINVYMYTDQVQQGPNGYVREGCKMFGSVPK